MPELAVTLEPEDDIERLEQAESIVRDYCGWHIAPVRTTSTHTFYGAREGKLFLPTLRLVSVTAVAVDGDPTEFDLATIGWHQSGWVEPHVGYRWPYTWTATRGLTITYTHGYDETPPSVTRVVQGLAQRHIDNPRGLKRSTAGPFTEEYDGALTPSDMNALAPYRLYTVG